MVSRVGGGGGIRVRVTGGVKVTGGVRVRSWSS